MPDLIETIKECIRNEDLNDEIGLIPKYIKDKEDFLHKDEYIKCFRDGLICQQYTDLKILDRFMNSNTN